jgi:hypothetical protein
MVYAEPYTQTRPEGVATLVAHLRGSVWQVVFDGQSDVHPRTIIEPRICAWCRYYKDADHNPTRRCTGEEYSLISNHGMCRICRQLNTLAHRPTRKGARK